jgi:sulfite exporter TauE/SafE
MALPILGAKVAAYTLLGLLLGLVGSVLTLNATTRAALLIAIGIFMVGNALRMLNVHPFFRYFAIETPSFLTRYIRRTAKNGESWITPLSLGVLTVLIPCGVTQAMMAVAIASGSPLEGAAIMFAFTLGASPVFFLVAYLTTQLGARLEKFLMRFVAVVVLVLGLVSVDNGLALAGAPSVIGTVQSAFRPQPVGDIPTLAIPDGSVITLSATNYGYYPQVLHAKSGEALILNVVTESTYSCARAFVIPALNVEQLLPENGIVPISIPAQQPGTVMRFTCSMGMYTGQIVFDL